MRIDGFATEILGLNETDLGGVKDMTMSIRPSSSPRRRVGRLRLRAASTACARAQTESQGRIQTAAGVLVYPEPDVEDVEIDEKDIRVDVYRSSGKGGQREHHRPAVRITHLPTGVVDLRRNAPRFRTAPARCRCWQLACSR